ncbi:uncharacterized protein BCR38DRAFT_423243 [Pseudomassariella vexata]|uniref:C2H2-type domain-containing protein n=1 Tax=Pseudomassariella vexata TaxID=1141098 RepID=A0A1Y2EC66_9PEZI|nr:uncharacterized protein BCR38DRAFT_423243 [Pseudomassariella vexata]ORY68435.1 hypothetical protein BCR38DRAFT_423243 [Pseudomassariella vexata]
MAPINTWREREPDEKMTESFNKSLIGFRKSCSASAVQEFEHATSFAVKRELLRIQRDQERLRAMMNLSRVKKFFQRMEEYSEILEAIVDVSKYMSFVWGAMKFLLHIAATNFTVDSFDSLLDSYERLGGKMPELKGRQALFSEFTGMRNCLAFLYDDVLEFHLGAYKCFTQFPERGQKKIIKAAWKDFELQIFSIENRLGAHKSLVELVARCLDYNISMGRISENDPLPEDDVSRISGKVFDYERERENSIQRGKEDESKRRAKQIEETLQWISPKGNITREIHDASSQVRKSFPNTCDWFTENDSFENWLKVETPTHSILWLRGNMVRKTTLASQIVDLCAERASDSSFQTIYFYCKGKDPEISSCLAIFQSLLWQQLQNIQLKKDGVEKYKQLIAYCHDRKVASGQQHLSRQELTKSLLDIFFELIDYQYVIIDGLDECEKTEIKQCLTALTAAVAQKDKVHPGSLRLLVSSRDIIEIKRPLETENTTAKVVNDHNEEAIKLYVMQRIEKFPDALGLDKDEATKTKISEKLTGKGKAGSTQGMFLFAKLVLDNLENSFDRDRLSKELDRAQFPKDIGEAYGRIIGHLKEQHAEQWDKIKDILGWLVCAKRPLQWHEIQAIVSVKEDSVEIEQCKFVKDVTEICGSLVHKRGTKIELIHHTAHDYVVNNHYVKVTEVEFSLATLCMQYLTLPCFGQHLSTAERTKFAKNGSYAFQDYAVSRWFHHIGKLVKLSVIHRSRNEAEDKDEGEGGEAQEELPTVLSGEKARKLAQVLDKFVFMYQDSIQEFPTPDETAQKECKGLENTIFYEHLILLWSHISKHERGNIDRRNEVSLAVMKDVLKKNREVLEDLSSKLHGDDAAKLQDYYGTNFFKCPRTLCAHFGEGFKEPKLREVHIQRHTRPFQCPVVDCQLGTIGFVSEKDTNKHVRNYHAAAGDGTGGDGQQSPFPHLNKSSNHARFTCDICGHKFTRKINLTGHTRSHFGERPYGCQTCGKKFTRVNDLRRHERLHLQM